MLQPISDNILIQAVNLWQKTFNDPKEFIESYFNIFNARNNLYCIYDREIISMLLSIPYRWNFFESLNFAYLSGICTSENNRHKGHCSKLLNETLKKLYEQGFYLCGLIAADDYLTEYYNKFSFTSCCTNEEFFFNKEESFDCSKENYELKKYLNILSEDCLKFFVRRNNCVIHTKNSLTLYNNKEYLRLGLFHNGKLTAFLIGKIYEDIIKVIDIDYINTEDKYILLKKTSSLYNKDIQCCYYEGTNLSKYQMLRVVNVLKTAEIYAKHNPEISINLTVKDGIIKQNNISMNIQNGKVNIMDDICGYPVIDIKDFTEKLFYSSSVFLMLDK